MLDICPTLFHLILLQKLPNNSILKHMEQKQSYL